MLRRLQSISGFSTMNSESTLGRRSRRTGLVLSFVLAGLLPVTRAAANEAANLDQRPDPAALIEDMAAALETLNYQGVFVHLHNGNVETMKVMHAYDDRGVRERLISLNGEAREVFRNNKLVTCIWPGSQSVIVSKSKPRDLFPEVNDTFTNSGYYDFVLGEDDRVAGIPAWVVSVKPKDDFRYGYRFWIDKQTNMLLRSMLTDSEDRSLEQLLFTDISYPESFPDQVLEANADSKGGYTWVDNVKKPDNGENVSFDNLPGGYEEISESYFPMPMNDTPYTHVMLSDGMASVSVYVEYLDDATEVSGNAGVSRMGAVNAYGRSLGNVFVMVVGEVPVSTVQAIGDSVNIAARSE